MTLVVLLRGALVEILVGVLVGVLVGGLVVAVLIFWYRLSAFGPPQNSDEFPEQTMLQPLEIGLPPFAI